MPVNISAGERTVKLVFVDLKDPTIQVDSVFAQQQMGSIDNLQNIAEQLASPDRAIVAAINGGFYDPSFGDTTQSWSIIQQDGEFIHLGDIGSVIAFSSNNKVRIENLCVRIKGSI